MDGETVGLDERFSNGADYPGDLGLPAEEAVNCHCTMDVGVKKSNGGGFGGGRNNPPTGRSNGMDDREKRIRRRIGDARVIGRDLYDETPEAIIERASAMNDELDRIWYGNPNTGNSVAAYEAYARYVRSFSTNAQITIEDFARIEGKELQIASWFSRLGFGVHFRNHNRHENKSDVRMYDMLFDFKRVTSPAHQQISTVGKKKLKTQGPGFVVDLSVSTINLEDALMECAHILEKEHVDRMLIIKDSQLIEINK